MVFFLAFMGTIFGVWWRIGAWIGKVKLTDDDHLCCRGQGQPDTAREYKIHIVNLYLEERASEANQRVRDALADMKSVVDDINTGKCWMLTMPRWTS